MIMEALTFIPESTNLKFKIHNLKLLSFIIAGVPASSALFSKLSLKNNKT
jgi:hypothetical protein